MCAKLALSFVLSLALSRSAWRAQLGYVNALCSKALHCGALLRLGGKLVLAIFLVLTAHSSNAKALPCSA